MFVIILLCMLKIVLLCQANLRYIRANLTTCDSMSNIQIFMAHEEVTSLLSQSLSFTSSHSVNKKQDPPCLHIISFQDSISMPPLPRFPSRNHLLKRHHLNTRQHDATSSPNQQYFRHPDPSYDVVGLGILHPSRQFIHYL